MENRKYPIEQADIDAAILKEQKRKVEIQPHRAKIVMGSPGLIKQAQKIWPNIRKYDPDAAMRVRGGPLTLDEAIERLGDDRIYRRASKGFRFRDDD